MPDHAESGEPGAPGQHVESRPPLEPIVPRHLRDGEAAGADQHQSLRVVDAPLHPGPGPADAAARIQPLGQVEIGIDIGERRGADFGRREHHTFANFWVRSNTRLASRSRTISCGTSLFSSTIMVLAPCIFAQRANSL